MTVLKADSGNYAMQFENMFTEHYGSVKYFAYALLKSEDDSQDIAQNIFTKLWASPSLWQGKSKEELGSYLFAMTKNATLNYIRHRKITTDYCQKTIERSIVEELFIEDKALDHVYYEETELLVRLVLSRLPERRRQIFVMSRFQHMSNMEIAEKLGISVRTVEHQIYQTLAEMKKVIFFAIFFNLL